MRVLPNLRVGVDAYLWKSGGTTQAITVPLRSLHLKHYLDTKPLSDCLNECPHNSVCCGRLSTTKAEDDTTVEEGAYNSSEQDETSG